MEKLCRACGVVLPLEAFGVNNAKSDGLMARCKPCRNAKAKANRDLYPRVREYDRERYEADGGERRWAQKLAQRFGITPDDYYRMLADQGGVCKLCGSAETNHYRGKVRRLSVDHCHSSGVIRGLLCTLCNVCIGAARDDVDLMARMIEYVREKGGRPCPAPQS